MEEKFITPMDYFGEGYYNDIRKSGHRNLFASKHGDLEIVVTESAQHIGDKVIASYNELLEEHDCEDKIKVTRGIIDLLCRSGSLKSMVSGSGPTVFGVYKTLSDAERAKKIISKNLNVACSVFAVESI